MGKEQKDGKICSKQTTKESWYSYVGISRKPKKFEGRKNCQRYKTFKKDYDMFNRFNSTGKFNRSKNSVPNYTASKYIKQNRIIRKTWEI